jgi:hypothetical protein
MLNTLLKILAWALLLTLATLFTVYVVFASVYGFILTLIWSIIMVVWVLHTPWPEVKEDDSS